MFRTRKELVEQSHEAVALFTKILKDERTRREQFERDLETAFASELRLLETNVDPNEPVDGPAEWLRFMAREILDLFELEDEGFLPSEIKLRKNRLKKFVENLPKESENVLVSQ